MPPSENYTRKNNHQTCCATIACGIIGIDIGIGICGGTERIAAAAAMAAACATAALELVADEDEEDEDEEEEEDEAGAGEGSREAGSRVVAATSCSALPAKEITANALMVVRK